MYQLVPEFLRTALSVSTCKLLQFYFLQKPIGIYFVDGCWFILFDYCAIVAPVIYFPVAISASVKRGVNVSTMACSLRKKLNLCHVYTHPVIFKNLIRL